MKTHHPRILMAGLFCGFIFSLPGFAAEPQFRPLQIQTNKEILLNLNSTVGLNYRLQVSSNLTHWQSLVTMQSTGLQQHLDSATPWQGLRFYRAHQAESNALTGDHIATTNGEVIMHMFAHASFLLSWNSMAIYVDPTNTSLISKGFPYADLILVTHDHPDHYNRTVISSLTYAGTAIVAPQYVYQLLVTANSPLTNRVTVLNNGASASLLGLPIEAVAATNAIHPAGRGNGYIVTMGGTRLYISGDTSATNATQIQRLQNIDVAFVVMDGNYNMSVTTAASFVRAFMPKIVYPYHYNTANPATFKSLLGTGPGIEVRMRKWD
jgi:L-ascorbate metabolism protein UlaG (beta-lactamase superfamily)